MGHKDGTAALRGRIRSGKVKKQDVARRLAELAFGRANDCVQLVLEDKPEVSGLDLSLLSEVKRNDKGTVEVRLIDRLRAQKSILHLWRAGRKLRRFDPGYHLCRGATG